MGSKVKYWIGLAEYDFKTAKVMFNGRRWLYVGFMCHQVVEKTLKAYYTWLKNVPPPFTHNLYRLTELCELSNELSEHQKQFLTKLDPLNIEARYPTHRQRILKALNRKECESLLRDTKNLKAWIKKRLPK